MSLLKTISVSLLCVTAAGAFSAEKAKKPAVPRHVKEFLEIDSDGSGKINTKEWAVHLQKGIEKQEGYIKRIQGRIKADKEKIKKKTFPTFDKYKIDKDDEVSAAEWAIKRKRAYSELSKILKVFDFNKDGIFDKKEAKKSAKLLVYLSELSSISSSKGKTFKKEFKDIFVVLDDDKNDKISAKEAKDSLRVMTGRSVKKAKKAIKGKK